MRNITITFVTLALGVTPAFAHGPQIQITNDGNKITTRNLLPNAPYNYAGAPSGQVSVYVIPLAPISAFGGTEYLAQPNAAFPVSDPGIAWGHGWSFTDATHYTTTFPVGSNFVESLTGGLKQWDGSAFRSAAHGAQLEGYRSSGTPAVSGSGTTSFAYSTILAPTAINPDPHGTAYWQLLGNGTIPDATHTPGAVDDGLYLQQLQLSLANQPAGSTIADSDPFYFVLYKGADQSAAVAAAQSAFPGASVQALPEPTAVGLLALGGGAFLRRRRRHTNAC